MTVANQKGEFFFSRNLPATTSTALLVVHLIFGVLVWGFFFYEQALGRIQIYLKVQQIFRNSNGGIAINFARKIPIFFVAKHYVME